MGGATPRGTAREMDNNPSPGNKAGGLTTILEKSLGAVAKGGASPLNDVVEYAEPLDGAAWCSWTPRVRPVLGDRPGGLGRDPDRLHHRPRLGLRLQAVAVDQALVQQRTLQRMEEDIDIDCGGDRRPATRTIEREGRRRSSTTAGGRLRASIQERGAGLRRRRVRALADRRDHVGERRPMTLKLSDRALLKSDAYIDGAWMSAASGESFAVEQPGHRRDPGPGRRSRPHRHARRHRGRGPRPAGLAPPRPPRSARRSCAAGSS